MGIGMRWWLVGVMLPLVCVLTLALLSVLVLPYP